MIQCVDKNVYEKPVWKGSYLHKGKEYFYNVTIGDDGLVLILEARKVFPAKTIALKILKEWRVKVGGSEYSRSLYLVKEEIPELSMGYTFKLTSQGLLPLPKDYKHRSNYPNLNDLMDCWEVEFPTEQVWNYFQKDAVYNRNLAQFILGVSIADGEENRGKIKSRLLKQYDFRKMTLEETIEKYGDHILIRRM